MAGRFPFDSQGHSGQNPLHNAQVRAALGLTQVDEALYLQRQQELQRDFQLRQMLLQEQIDHQNRLDSMIHEQRLKAIGEHLQEFPDLQQHYSRILLNEQNILRERAQMQQEELQRRQALVQSQAQQHPTVAAATAAAVAAAAGGPVPPAPAATAAAAAAGATASTQPAAPAAAASGAVAASAASAATGVAAAAAAPPNLLRDIAADSLAGNAVKRSDLERRAFAPAEEETESVAKKRPRSGTSDSTELDTSGGDRKPKSKKFKRAPKKHDRPNAFLPEDAVAENKVEVATHPDMPIKPSVQALLDFATSQSENVESVPAKMEPMQPYPPPMPPMAMVPPMAAMAATPRSPLGTLTDLLAAASSESKTDEAVDTLMGIKRYVEWSESEGEADEQGNDADLAAEEEKQRAVSKGDVIQLSGFTSILPQLPEEPEVVMTSKGKKKKFKGLLDDDSVEAKPSGKKKSSKKDPKTTDSGDTKPSESTVVEYPYPIDTWWPSVTSIRRERKSVGEPQDEDAFEDNPEVLGAGSDFRANVDKIKTCLSTDVTPGVLEKIPHCRIHRMAMKKRKNPSAPELAHCFQVTELYPNEVMVCCSQCGVWRHTSCGGHYKPYSVRESIDTPFVAVCDRCHEEEKILRDYPVARKRIDRQRAEQVRRGLATSAAMRQASFSKHGGTYKWPLGSVSATHIGGHTRSVHSRHDKAEKQWMDMATRLGRGYGYRPKERVKVRTKELERLLVAVEDAEGHTDRHNMMLFLLQDTLREHPVGFELKRRNIFDPEEDDMPNEAIGEDEEDEGEEENCDATTDADADADADTETSTSTSTAAAAAAVATVSPPQVAKPGAAAATAVAPTSASSSSADGTTNTNSPILIDSSEQDPSSSSSSSPSEKTASTTTMTNKNKINKNDIDEVDDEGDKRKHPKQEEEQQQKGDNDSNDKKENEKEEKGDDDDIKNEKVINDGNNNNKNNNNSAASMTKDGDNIENKNKDGIDATNNNNNNGDGGEDDDNNNVDMDNNDDEATKRTTEKTSIDDGDHDDGTDNGKSSIVTPSNNTKHEGNEKQSQQEQQQQEQPKKSMPEASSTMTTTTSGTTTTTTTSKTSSLVSPFAFPSSSIPSCPLAPPISSTTTATSASTSSSSSSSSSSSTATSSRIAKKESTLCSRNGCSRKPRFDSLFCSDSCGVSALESDLLRTFQYASDIHPSLLRH